MWTKKGSIAPVKKPLLQLTPGLFSLNISSESGKISAPYQVPEKYASCENLVLDGNLQYKCAQDLKIWEDFLRAVDWVDWQPPMPGLFKRFYLKIRYYFKRKEN